MVLDRRPIECGGGPRRDVLDPGAQLVTIVPYTAESLSALGRQERFRRNRSAAAYRATRAPLVSKPTCFRRQTVEHDCRIAGSRGPRVISGTAGNRRCGRTRSGRRSRRVGSPGITIVTSAISCSAPSSRRDEILLAEIRHRTAFAGAHDNVDDDGVRARSADDCVGCCGAAGPVATVSAIFNNTAGVRTMDASECFPLLGQCSNVDSLRRYCPVGATTGAARACLQGGHVRRRDGRGKREPR
jgi:hypothetical protein